MKIVFEETADRKGKRVERLDKRQIRERRRAKLAMRRMFHAIV